MFLLGTGEGLTGVLGGLNAEKVKQINLLRVVLLSIRGDAVPS